MIEAKANSRKQFKFNQRILYNTILLSVGTNIIRQETSRSMGEIWQKTNAWLQNKQRLRLTQQTKGLLPTDCSASRKKLSISSVEKMRAPCTGVFVHLKHATECKERLDIHWLACISKSTHSLLKAEHHSRIQAVKECKCNSIYPTNNLFVQTVVQKAATASSQDKENVPETSSVKQRRKERKEKLDT